MPKISALPPMVTAADDDEAPIVDKSASSTKKWTLTLLKTYLQSLISWITSAMVADGFAVQMLRATYNAVQTGTTIVPYDDTIPQSNEGNEFMSLAITPKSATNILVIEVTAMLASSVAGSINFVGSIFQDSGANALSTGVLGMETAAKPSMLVFRHIMVAGTTSATTFKFRCGTNSAGTTTLNGFTSARKFGDIPKSEITITEYKAS